MAHVVDTLVLGSGIAGLTYALRMAERGTVAVLTKSSQDLTNTAWAQGGIAAVLSDTDSFDSHVEDTIVAGDGLNRLDVVRICVEEGPERIQELMALGVKFDPSRDGSTEAHGLDLTREGGHSQRRVVHSKDMTGAAIQAALSNAVAQHPNIEVLEHRMAIDLITRARLGLQGPDRCLGAYVLDTRATSIDTYLAKSVLLATGGAGKVYLYTSNPDVATGDGISMAWRAGARVANMEFFQFHPTCLYHPEARTFLITEACRGEGGTLRRIDGEAFMSDYHDMADLAPRDVVARAIDSELKRSGDDHVVLDMTHLDAPFVEDHFPGVFKRLMDVGIDMRTQPIPVVPAAHYCCGGVVSDVWGRTNIPGLLVAGETAHTGLHGANRLASNSLLEGLVFSERAARITEEIQGGADLNLEPDIPDWNPGLATDPDELVLVSHAWDAVRRLMWNYVGIVRSNRRLERAKRRLSLLQEEIKSDYWNFTLTQDLIELRNLAVVADLVIDCAMARRESRGLHYTLDYPFKDEDMSSRDTVMIRGRRAVGRRDPNP
jgi:L-aspartate oxidase